MHLLRPATRSTPLLSRAGLHRPVTLARPHRALTTTPNLLAAQGYGDPNNNGDPRTSDPQAQGRSNYTKHAAEHPGPEAPAAGKSSGGGGQKSPADASAQSGGSRSKEAKETGSSPSGGEVAKGGAKPKISDKRTPGQGADAGKESDVEKHNREFEKGHDRAGRESS